MDDRWLRLGDHWRYSGNLHLKEFKTEMEIDASSYLPFKFQRFADNYGLELAASAEPGHSDLSGTPNATSGMIS